MTQRLPVIIALLLAGTAGAASDLIDEGATFSGPTKLVIEGSKNGARWITLDRDPAPCPSGMWRCGTEEEYQLRACCGPTPEPKIDLPPMTLEQLRKAVCGE